MASLVNYEASSESDDEGPKLGQGLLKSQFIKSVVAAPAVNHKDEALGLIPVDSQCRELIHNPRYEELYAPIAGPKHPFKSDKQLAPKNTLTGFVEDTHLNEFLFETQRRTFESRGYSIDPNEKDKVIGDLDSHAFHDGKTIFEKTSKAPKRKREYNWNAEDEDFTGPWAKFKDEQTVSVPSAEDQVYLDAYLSKKAVKNKRTEEAPIDERTVLHIPDPNDYQGRSFLYPPHDIDGVNFRETSAPPRCYLPKKLIHEWNQAHARGVAVTQLFPKSGHLMLSGGMDSKIKLWELYHERRLVRTYLGHRQAIRDLSFNTSGSQFLSASFDRFVKQWDTETGKCIGQFNLKKVAFSVKFNPDEDKQHLFLAGCADKKILCYDTRSGEVVQCYDRHLGAVNTVTFVDNNRRFVSTSDDKSLRVWEWDIPVDFKYIADPSMHSMPAVRLSPNGKFLLCQSLDNQINVLNVFAGFKRMRNKSFRGHMVSGYACTMDFSPDLRYICSGDGDGYCTIWQWKSCRMVHRWKAHEGVCINTFWLPHETSKVLTAGWDGNIKLWD
ncbi:pre-mRNA-processing factor 17 [Cichlidogyrus casuarinus]|uniref:Pre-mRNA-processing factor 17 n=1 Tax=Cichlidogyrus casuarinus TaxID=1844966 RepID=A0ABD2Q090_9PLAT